MNWESVIGLEVHIELATQTKIFCGCSTAFGAPPNTQCCPVCMGLPGTLPALNKTVVEYAVRAGLALGCAVNLRCAFDRKNYFYPDLPKAYQISQLYSPLCHDGRMLLTLPDGQEKTIGIHEIHMEEDAGKLIHSDAGYTCIDYNRCGIPLIEIVTEPDFRSSEEVLSFLAQLKSMLEYLEISDCKMQEGSMRADVNLSLRPLGSAALGTRTEMKNLSSFRSIGRAIDFERRRQAQLLELGQAVARETRRWDEDADESRPLRTKESAQDYRYFPEPDIPPLVLGEDWLASLQAMQPELAPTKCRRYKRDFGLSDYDAAMITQHKALANFFEAAVALGASPKAAANWILGPMLRLMKGKALAPSQLKVRPEMLAQLIGLVEAGSVNRNTAVQVFEALFDGGENPAAYIAAHGLGQVQDSQAVEAAIRAVLETYPELAADYRGGKTKVFGFLVGQSMRELKGKADPALVNRLLKAALET